MTQSQNKKKRSSQRKSISERNQEFKKEDSTLRKVKSIRDTTQDQWKNTTSINGTRMFERCGKGTNNVHTRNY